MIIDFPNSLRNEWTNFIKVINYFPKHTLICLLCCIFLVDVVNADDTTKRNTLRVESTSSLVDSGVMTALIEDFSRRHPEINVQLSDAGALQVLEHAREGKADIVISHHPLGEKRFVEQGYGRDRVNFVFSEFVLFGPPGDIPELTKADIVEAMRILAEEQVEFLVPSSRSGVYAVIKELWVTAGIDPNWVGYENTGISGARNLKQAADMEAYTIMDYGTYLAKREEYGDSIVPLIRGDIALRNIYSVTIVRSDKVPGVNEELAQIFYDYLIGEEGQDLVKHYGERTLNVSFLTPAANFDVNLRTKRANEEAEHYKQQSELMRGLLIISSIFLSLVVASFLGKRRADKKRLETEEKAQFLEKDRDSAKEANQWKTAFLANVSHELRTPLQAVIGYSTEVKDAHPDYEHDTQEALSQIRSSGIHLAHMIDDLLAAAKLESGQMLLEKSSFSISSVVNDVVKTINPLTELTNNKVIEEVDENIGYMNSDIFRVRQILINLASNANKFTSKGVVTIGAHLSSKHKDDGKVTFFVRDTGKGIPKSQLDNIFTRFYTISTIRTRAIKQEGIGLGLSIVKQCVDALGGTIEVESEVNVGTTFCVNLPIGDINQSEIDACEDEVITGSLKILVTDDNDVSRGLFVRALQSDGHDVYEASDGGEALTLLIKENFDVALIDVHMPVYQGIEVIDRFRQASKDYKTMIYLLTADAAADIVDSASKLNVPILVKPITSDDLLAAVRRRTNFKPLKRVKAEVVRIYPTQNETQSIVDLSLIEKVESMGDDKTFALSIIDTFVRQTRANLNKLYEAINEKRIDDARKIIHLLKSSTGSIGAKKMHKYLEELKILEDDAISKKADDIIKHFEELYLETVNALKNTRYYKK